MHGFYNECAKKIMRRTFGELSPDQNAEFREQKLSKLSSTPESPGIDNSMAETSLADLHATLSNINSQLKRLDKLDTIETKVTDLQKSVTEALQTANNAEKIAKETQQHCVQLQLNYDALEQKHKALEFKINNITEQNLRLECQSRRSNLKIDKVPEVQNEKPEDTLKTFQYLLEKKMAIPNAKNIVIERCHRLPGPKPRTIIAKFNHYGDRELVWRSRDALTANTAYWMREDFPREYETRRSALKPVLAAAKQMDEYKEKVSLRIDKLVLNGKRYGVDQMHELPDGLKPEQLATKTIGDVTVFFGKSSPFSNFHHAEFRIDNTTYSGVEQYFQSEKAKFFSDDLTHHKIMSTTDPYSQWRAGQNTKNFDADQWLKGPALKVMEAGLLAKFGQNGHLLRALLSTNNNLLAESSPRNLFWGTGVGINDAAAADRDRWTGDNKLGFLLMDVRQRLSMQT